MNNNKEEARIRIYATSPNAHVTQLCRSDRPCFLVLFASLVVISLTITLRIQNELVYSEVFPDTENITEFTYHEFTQQYQHLYGSQRVPPRRMEAWFQYAQEQGCAVNAMHEARMDLAHLFPDLEDPTDEGQGREGTKVFDLYRQIERDLKHFRRLIWYNKIGGSGEKEEDWEYHGDAKVAMERRKAMLKKADALMDDGMTEMVRVRVDNGKITDKHGKIRSKLPNLLDIAHALPDLVLFICFRRDEPRVLAKKPSDETLKAWKHNPALRHISNDHRGQSTASLHHDVCGKQLLQDVIPQYERTVLPSPPAHLAPENTSTWSDILDYHGFFLGASNYDVTYEQVPFFSQAKINGCYNDILYPSQYYIFDYRDFKKKIPSTVHTPWDQKQTDGGMFWRGSSTGLFSIDNTTHLKAHRQRMVLFSNAHKNSSAGNALSDPDRGIVDAVFTRYAQQHGVGPSMYDAYGPTGKRVNHAEVFAHRYLLDMDGNTFSRRFLPFLFSGSVIYRGGIFTDWLFAQVRPWRHYIPVDVKLEKLGMTYRYYSEGSGTDDGTTNMEKERGVGEGEVAGAEKKEEVKKDERARRIAETAKSFAERRVRPVDLTCYVYRLLIEYADLFYPDETE